VLDCTLLARCFGIATESWKGPLAETVTSIGAELVPHGNRLSRA
jgi:hypothetical protein